MLPSGTRKNCPVYSKLILLNYDIALSTFLASLSLTCSCKLNVIGSILYKVPNFVDGHFITAIDLWKKIILVDQPSQGIIKQHAWDAPLITKRLDCLLSSAVSPDFIRLSSVSANVGGGSEWLNALPIKNCGCWRQNAIYWIFMFFINRDCVCPANAVVEL